MPTSVSGGEYDFSADAKEFWQGIRDGVDPSHLTAIQERMKEHCPSVDVFSFEVVDEPTGKIGSSPRTLEADTPKSCVDVWNSAKLVGLLSLDSDVVCGAAIGTVKTGGQDFKVCAVASSVCEYGTHNRRSLPLGFPSLLVSRFGSSSPLPRGLPIRYSLVLSSRVRTLPMSLLIRRRTADCYSVASSRVCGNCSWGASSMVSLKAPPRQPLSAVKTDLPP